MLRGINYIKKNGLQWKDGPSVFLDRPSHHLAKVISYPRLVDLDDLSHRPWSVVLVHSQLLSASLKGADLAVKCAKDLVRYLSASATAHKTGATHT